MPNHLTTVFIALLTASVLFWLQVRLTGDDLATLMRDLQGERVYTVQQQGQGVGFLRTQTRKDAAGNWVMQQQLHINLLNAPAFETRQQLTFAATPPYALLSASLAEQRQDQHQQVNLDAADDGYRATVQRGANVEQRALSWQFGLNDQLSLEKQLTPDAELNGLLRSRYLDLQTLQVSEREQQLSDRSSTGYRLTSKADNSITELDTRRRLIRFSAPHQFNFQLTDQDSETLQRLTANQPAQWSASAAVAPLTQDLSQPRTMQSLTLALTPQGPRTLAQLGLPRTLSADQQPIPAAAGTALRFLQASLTLPVGHPTIRQVLKQQQQRHEKHHDQTPALAQQLIDLTRSQLLYAANQPAGSVLNAIASGRGECVDFADLLTTLARSQGIPSRTVYGVAYSALPTPGFRFHAWNQILHQHQWHALDPTWDQAVADATHIALDDQTLAALASAMQQQAIAFTPVQ
ncbi:MAG: hypothetical protein GWP70_12935 [Proteobacteria bacterium]|nr:hypothetical protein [Pseudomonadota bacterium]